MDTSLSPGTHVIFANDDPTVIGTIVASRDITTSDGLAPIHPFEAGEPEDGLVPVRWERLGGDTYDHWEDPANLQVVNVRRVRAVRIKFGPDVAAEPLDPLGRKRIGFVPGLTPAELWERGRGVWRFRADKVAEAAIALLTFDGIVQMVGTVQSLGIHGDRLSIDGTPLPAHRLIGLPDPLDNASRNPITYGQVWS